MVAPRASADDAIVATVNGRPVWGSCVAIQAQRGATTPQALDQCIAFELLAQARRAARAMPRIPRSGSSRPAPRWSASSSHPRTRSATPSPAQFGRVLEQGARSQGLAHAPPRELRASAYVRVPVAAGAPPEVEAAAKASCADRIAAALAHETRAVLGPNFARLAERPAAGPASSSTTRTCRAYAAGGLEPQLRRRAVRGCPRSGAHRPRCARRGAGTSSCGPMACRPRAVPAMPRSPRSSCPSVRRATSTTGSTQIGRPLGVHVTLDQANDRPARRGLVRERHAVRGDHAARRRGHAARDRRRVRRLRGRDGRQLLDARPAHEWALLTAHYGVVLAQLESAFGTLALRRAGVLHRAARAARCRGARGRPRATTRCSRFRTTRAGAAGDRAARAVRAAVRRAAAGDGVTGRRAAGALVAVRSRCSRASPPRPRAPRPRSRPRPTPDRLRLRPEQPGVERDGELRRRSPRAWGSRSTAVSDLEWGDARRDDILFLVLPAAARRSGQARRRSSRPAATSSSPTTSVRARTRCRRWACCAPRSAGRSARLLRGPAWAPIATARGDHPIAHDVGEVVTNHPAVLTTSRAPSTVVGVRRGRDRGRRRARHRPVRRGRRSRASSSTGCCRFPGNVAARESTSCDWLDRAERPRAPHRAAARRRRRCTAIRGRTSTTPGRGALGRSIAELNIWLSERHEWLLTPRRDEGRSRRRSPPRCCCSRCSRCRCGAARSIDGALAAVLAARRGATSPHALVVAADAGGGSNSRARVHPARSGAAPRWPRPPARPESAVHGPRDRARRASLVAGDAAPGRRRARPRLPPAARAAEPRPGRGAVERRAPARAANSTSSTTTWPSCVVLSAHDAHRESPSPAA